MSLLQGGACLSCPDTVVELGGVLPHLAGVVIEEVVAAAGLLFVLARARADTVACPACGVVWCRAGCTAVTGGGWLMPLSAGAG